MARVKLSGDDLARRAAALPSWSVANERLSRSFSFPDFQSALDFVNRVGAAAEEMNHHPDIRLGWGKAAFEIWTHDVGGITESDFALAKRIDELAVK